MDWVQNIGIGLGCACLAYLLVLEFNGPFKVWRDARRARRDKRNGW